MCIGNYTDFKYKNLWRLKNEIEFIQKDHIYQSTEERERVY